MMYRAGGVAAALSIAVSGGAYAATQAGDGDGGKPPSETGPSGRHRRLQWWRGVSRSVGRADHRGAVRLGLHRHRGEHRGARPGRGDRSLPRRPRSRPRASMVLCGPPTRSSSKDGTEGLAHSPVQCGGHREGRRGRPRRHGLGQHRWEVRPCGLGSGGGGGESSSPAPAANASGDGTTPEGAAGHRPLAHGSYGWGDGEFSCLQSLWNRESGLELPGSERLIRRLWHSAGPPRLQDELGGR